MMESSSTEAGFLDLTLDLQERGGHARILGLNLDDCAAPVSSSYCFHDVDIVWQDFYRFGWAIEDAFRTAGLDHCVVSGGGLLVIREEKLALTRQSVVLPFKGSHDKVDRPFLKQTDAPSPWRDRW